MFRIRASLVLFLTLFLIQMNAYSDSATTSLVKLLNNIQTLTADFKQTMKDKNAHTIQQAAGHMALQRPGKFRWDVTRPVAQLVVTDGARLWIYDPDLEQVTIRFLTKEVGDSPAMLLSHTNATLEKDFRVEAIHKKQSELQWFLLTPKNQKSLFSSIQFGFLKNQIREMVLQDHLGHTTAITFYEVRENPTIAASQFSFKVPPKVDVIDETRH